jgi:uncharacterized protein (TIGR00369 family)
VSAADRELTAQVASVAPFTTTLGIELVSASPQEVRAQLQWREELCTAGGVLHGGALMGFADNVGGFCAFLNLPEGSGGTATIESKTNFFGSVRHGVVHAISRPLHTGRRTIVVDTELYDDSEKLVARVTQTQAVL